MSFLGLTLLPPSSSRERVIDLVESETEERVASARERGKEKNSRPFFFHSSQINQPINSSPPSPSPQFQRRIRRRPGRRPLDRRRRGHGRRGRRRERAHHQQAALPGSGLGEKGRRPRPAQGNRGRAPVERRRGDRVRRPGGSALRRAHGLFQGRRRNLRVRGPSGAGRRPRENHRPGLEGSRPERVFRVLCRLCH